MSCVRGYPSADLDYAQRRCITYDSGDVFLVSPACMHDIALLPQVSWEDIQQYLGPYILDATRTYDDETGAFWYHETDIIWDESLYTYMEQTPASLISGGMIALDKTHLAYEALQSMSIFAAVRDTSTYGPCRKQNYDVALQHLDGLTLAPGEQLNMNTLIAHDPAYCEGTLGKYMFYQGVCGGSTQLFWNALVNPYIRVVERHPHSEFWTNFYGNMGEDAGIYERSKELIIENTADQEIYFMTFLRPDGNTVLLSIYPQKTNRYTYIQKDQTGMLSASLSRKIIDPTGHLVDKQERNSRYIRINTTSD